MKNQIQVTLGTWRDNISNKNKFEGIKKKKEREDLENIYNKYKTDIKERHKELHDKIQSNHFQKEEKRKNEEIQRKIKLKKDIEEKIKKEKKIKDEVEERINNYHNDNMEILNRINNQKISKNNSSRLFSPIKNTPSKRSTSALMKKDDDPVRKKLLI
jgi:hypothetical protein